GPSGPHFVPVGASDPKMGKQFHDGPPNAKLNRRPHAEERSGCTAAARRTILRVRLAPARNFVVPMGYVRKDFRPAHSKAMLNLVQTNPMSRKVQENPLGELASANPACEQKSHWASQVWAS